MSDALRQAILTHPDLSDRECEDLIDETYTLEAQAQHARAGPEHEGMRLPPDALATIDVTIQGRGGYGYTWNGPNHKDEAIQRRVKHALRHIALNFGQEEEDLYEEDVEIEAKRYRELRKMVRNGTRGEDLLKWFEERED